MNQMLAMPVGMTLDRFIKQKQVDFPFASGELSQLLRDIALAGKIINREVNRAGLMGITGEFGAQNVQGEAQQKLDVIANIRFVRALKNGGEVCAIISEEDDHMIDTGNHQGKYIVAMDPMDGSSNIDANVSIGTIFSIYRRVSPVGSPPIMADVMQSGIRQIAAGYLIYGSSTMLVYTTGHGVNGFTYEHSLGEFFLSNPGMKIPEDGSLYSVNEGNYYEFSKAIQRVIDGYRKQKLTARYIGSLVADFHRNLIKGGIFLYPPTRTNTNGKLRLLYECYPLAFVVEQAGGMATDGEKRILDIEPMSLHQRCPLYIGSRKLVESVNCQAMMKNTAVVA